MTLGQAKEPQIPGSVRDRDARLVRQADPERVHHPDRVRLDPAQRLPGAALQARTAQIAYLQQRAVCWTDHGHDVFVRNRRLRARSEIGRVAADGRVTVVERAIDLALGPTGHRLRSVQRPAIPGLGDAAVASNADLAGREAIA